jgi:hypothetical protein
MMTMLIMNIVTGRSIAKRGIDIVMCPSVIPRLKPGAMPAAMPGAIRRY